MIKNNLVLITGAAGAVGHYLVEGCLNEGAIVIATDLPSRLAQASFPSSANLRVLPLDLSKNFGLSYQPDIIINAAAIVDIAKSWEDLEPINVEAVSRLLKASKSEPIFIHISSASIYAENAVNPIDEKSPIKGSSPYEWSKISSEGVLKALATTQAPDNSGNYDRFYVLRPSLIYGPRCRFLGAALSAIPTLLSDFTTGIDPRIVHMPMIGLSGGPKTNWVHAEDVARAAIYLANNTPKSKDPVSVYNVCDTEAPSFGDVITEYIKSYGFNVLATIPIPPPETIRKMKPILEKKSLYNKYLNPTLKFLWEAFGHGYKSGLSVKLDLEAVSYAFKNTIFSNKKLRKTGFQFKWRLSDGVCDALTWYRKNNWI